VRVTHTATRWVFCFVALPAAWIAASLAGHLQAVEMIPGAVIAALVSALTAYLSGRGKRAALGYLLGTGLIMVLALVIAIATIFTVGCDRGETEGAC
jgi:hypothetical protein